MSNKCSSKCWWRCGIPSLEHIDPSVQQQLFSKPFWFLEQDCDSECYCTTDDNLNEDCEIGQIKYGNCLDYTQWNTTSYHEPCKDLSPPQTECGDGCCDTYNGSKICCNNQCVLSDKCCGNKVLGLDEECCDDKIVKKCRRFETGNSENNTILNETKCGGDPCGAEKCGCGDDKECCQNAEGIKECVDKGRCCGGRLPPVGRECCDGKICDANSRCINNNKCCREAKIVELQNGTESCCASSEINCNNECCAKRNCKQVNGVFGCYGCPPGEVEITCDKGPDKGKRACMPKNYKQCGCIICLGNSKCFVGGEPGPGGQPAPKVDYCCPSHQGYVLSPELGCCNMARIGLDLTINPPAARCCEQGTRACSDGECRKRCYKCVDQECNDDQSCCPGAGCYRRNGNNRCCFGGTPFAHICADNELCCGKAGCCTNNEVCCGTSLENLQCLDTAKFKCCLPFGPCPIDKTCCGPNCCANTQRCINGQCFGPGDNPAIPPNA